MPRHKVAVIGGGIVGVCCGSYLLRSGFDVTIIERHEIGKHASAVNAGGIADVSIPPFAMPEVWRHVPSMLFDSNSGTPIRWRHAPFMIPWALRFLKASSRSEVARIARTRAQLLSHTHEAYAPLIGDAGAQDLVADGGWSFVYETDQALRSGMKGHNLCKEFGIELEVLSGDEFRELEPEISSLVKHAVLMPKAKRTTNPRKFTQRLAEAFVHNGGKVVHATVRGHAPSGGDGIILKLDTGEMKFDRAVLSAGAWSKTLGKAFGLKLPIESVRGYNAIIASPGFRVNTLVASAERQFGCATMDDGSLRLGSMAELDDVDRAPDFDRAERFIRQAKALFPKLEFDIASRSMGGRPATPDSLPIIDRSPRDMNLYIATGHGHSGMSMGAMTGKLLAELMTGKPTSLPLDPFSVKRFM